jgi:hypothetical protein
VPQLAVSGDFPQRQPKFPPNTNGKMSGLFDVLLSFGRRVTGWPSWGLLPVTPVYLYLGELDWFDKGGWRLENITDESSAGSIIECAMSTSESWWPCKIIEILG